MDGKGFYKFSLILLALVLSLCVEAQNLVSNPSFEEHDGCPNSGSWIPNGQVFYWDGGGVQYFNECATSSDFDVPDNFLGSQEPYAGNAYVGTSFWTISPALEMHPLKTQLSSSLVENATYHVQFYVSLWDISWYAIKNMGVYFSSDVPPSSIDSLLNCEPQVRYEGDFISDKEGWTLVSGSFVAQGGERFMTIGNFDGHSGTNTIFVNGPPPPAGQPDYHKLAGYFIDDVSVVPDSITAVGEVTADELSHQLYPNPNIGEFTLSMVMSDHDVAAVTVWNISGQQVHAQQLISEFNTVKLDVVGGLYLYSITLNGTPKWTGKVSISSH